tara:strand:+ start:1816 stop:2235 length:420 start_codon:yes stop_codon:yes gene_type:complete
MAAAATNTEAAHDLGNKKTKAGNQLSNSLKGGAGCSTLPNAQTNALQFLHANSNLTIPNGSNIHRDAHNNLRKMTVAAQGDAVKGFDGPKGKVLSGGSSFSLKTLIDTLMNFGSKRKSRKTKRRRKRAKKSRKSRRRRR